MEHQYIISVWHDMSPNGTGCLCRTEDKNKWVRMIEALKKVHKFTNTTSAIVHRENYTTFSYCESAYEIDSYKSTILFYSGRYARNTFKKDGSLNLEGI